MKRVISLITATFDYHRIILLITMLSVMVGMYSLYVMPKQEFPIFTIRQGVVVGVYPGANSLEVEEQLTKPLERFIFTYKEVRKSKTHSYSKDGISYIFVELNDDVHNKDDVWSKIKHGLAGFKAQLPNGVLAVIANDDFGDTSALLISMESETRSYRSLQKYMEHLEDRLRTIESVSNLRRFGEQREQISIYIEKEKISAYGISLAEMVKTLATKGYIVPSGVIDNDTHRIPIHISRPYLSETDLEEQIIYSDAEGNFIRLKDVASVVREYPKPANYTTNNGKKALILSAEMRDGYNIVAYGEEVGQAIAAFEQTLPPDITIRRIADQPKVVKNSTVGFLKELLIAIISVIAVTMVLLPFKVASVAAVSIPISVFISLGIMYNASLELNTVTLAALVVVLGMIVDNSIVVVDGYITKLGAKEPRRSATIESAAEYFKPIFSATLAIGVTFFPLVMSVSGQLYDFAVFFPWTVLITLSVSMLMALFLTPYLQYVFITKGLVHAETSSKGSLFDHMQKQYDRLIEYMFKYPKRNLLIGVLMVILSLPLALTLKMALMPVAERDQFAVEIYLPQGTSLPQTEKVAKDLEQHLQKDKRITSITSFIGTSSPRFHTVYAPKLGGTNYAQFIVNTVSAEATYELLDEYTNTWAYHYPNAYVKFKQLTYQIDADNDVEIRLSGDDIKALKKAAEALIPSLQKIDGALRVSTDFEETLPAVNVALNPIEANRLGINESLLGLFLTARYSDVPVTNVWEGDYNLPVVLKSQWPHKDPIAQDVENEQILGLFAPSVALRQFADVTADFQEGQIARRNGVRTLSVNIDVKRNYKVSDVQTETEKIVKKINQEQHILEGINLSWGGVEYFNRDTIPRIIKGLSAAIVITFLILLMHFKKISLAVLVILSLSFCIPGAVAGYKIMQVDFSFTSVLGLISLIGIIMRNGIIMYDYTENLRHKYGMELKAACIEAAKRRMRPIFLTSAAASMGVVPMLIGKNPLWFPMASVIFFGTIISMLFILTVLPLMYWYFFQKEEN